MYPTADRVAGAPFENANLKLAVMSALLSDGLINLGAPSDLAAFVAQRPVDLENEGWEFSPECYDYLVRYPLTETLLAFVTDIVFDGGNEIYPYAWYHWDGESNEFDVASLRGIERCANLVSFAEHSMVDECDLRLLTPLAKLANVSLSEADHPNARALLELPALKTLRCFDTSFSDPDVVRELVAKGIAVIRNS